MADVGRQLVDRAGLDVFEGLAGVGGGQLVDGCALGRGVGERLGVGLKGERPLDGLGLEGAASALVAATVPMARVKAAATATLRLKRRSMFEDMVISPCARMTRCADGAAP
ncbi:hypothetical protein [Streptomyces sp. NPDC017673]|uniref:hypothetical protein n=1 Tax=unclassified Streptomyces TaxID=2593676 RepID=UPI0037B4439E